MTDLGKELQAVLEAGISDDAFKAIKKKVDAISEQIEDDVFWSLKDRLAQHLVAWVEEMAKRTVEQILEGNEEQMRRYLGCEKRGPDGAYIGWTGRSDSDQSWGRKRDDYEWHPVIHGRLFEQGALALRQKIVEAHAGLLKNERILDLEDQVKGLVAQVNKATAEKEAMWERVRHIA